MEPLTAVAWGTRLCKHPSTALLEHQALPYSKPHKLPGLPWSQGIGSTLVCLLDKSKWDGGLGWDVIFHTQTKPGLAVLLKDETGISGTADNGLFPACACLENVLQLISECWESKLGCVQSEHAALRANTVVAHRRAAGGFSAQRMGTTPLCEGNRTIWADQLWYRVKSLLILL